MPTRTLANSEHPDKMPRGAALVYTVCYGKTIFREGDKFYMKLTTCDPSIYTCMEYPKFIYQTGRKKPVL